MDGKSQLRIWQALRVMNLQLKDRRPEYRDRVIK